MGKEALSPKEVSRLERFSKLVSNVIIFGGLTRDGQVVKRVITVKNAQNVDTAINWSVNSHIVGIWDRMAQNMYQFEFMPSGKLKAAADAIIETHQQVHQAFKEMEVDELNNIWKRE